MEQLDGEDEWVSLIKIQVNFYILGKQKETWERRDWGSPLCWENEEKVKSWLWREWVLVGKGKWGENCVLQITDEDGEEKVKPILKSLFTDIMSAGKERVAGAVDRLRSRLHKESQVGWYITCFWFKKFSLCWFTLCVLVLFSTLNYLNITLYYLCIWNKCCS